MFKSNTLRSLKKSIKVKFIWAFPFLKKESVGLSASIFSKKKRIYAAIPNAVLAIKER